MSDNPSGLNEVIGASVSQTKPDFREIEAERLQMFVRRHSGLGSDAVVTNLRGGGASAGASSGIVIFTVENRQARRDFVLRYAPMNHAGRIFAEYGIAEQCELQTRLSRAGLPVAPGLWLDPDGSEIGLPGFVMPYVDGRVADASPYTGGLFAAAEPGERQKLFDEVLGALGRIHGVDWQRLELTGLVKAAEGRTPIERYLNWFWETARWVGPDCLGRLDAVRQRLIRDQPAYHADDHRLVHGDPGLGNYMFREFELVSILDWELAGIVHPAMDIAMQCNLNTLFRAAAPAALAATIPSDEAWIARYEAITGNRITDFDFFRRFVTFPSLVVMLSMSRNVPEVQKAAHLAMMEPLWAIAESA